MKGITWSMREKREKQRTYNASSVTGEEKNGSRAAHKLISENMSGQKNKQTQSVCHSDALCIKVGFER